MLAKQNSGCLKPKQYLAKPSEIEMDFDHSGEQ